jgi:predicted secreted protein
MTNLRPLILLALAALSACAATGSEADSTTVTLADQGHTVRLNRGGILAVKLDAQLGTGFIWSLVQNDVHVLAPLGNPETEHREGSRPGVVEVQVFRFRAKAAGKSVLKFANAQPWEKNVKPLKTFGITVEVH